MNPSPLPAGGDARAWALYYASRGWHGVPVPPGTKGKTADGKESMAAGWNRLRLGPDDVEVHFPPGRPMNVGLLLGTEAGLVDVDLDDPAALRAAHELLPPTRAVAGRPGSPRSHRFYVCTDQPDRGGHREYQHPVTREMLLELRSTAKNGAAVMSIVAPSTHPGSGEACAWEGEVIEPPERRYAEVETACRAVAAAALIGKHWPGRHARHDARLALAGGLARLGLAEHEALAFLRAVQAAAGDDGDEADERDACRSTYRKLNDGEPFTGWPSLPEHLGPDGQAVVRQAREWLSPPEPPTPGGGAACATPPRPKVPPLPWRPFPVAALPPAAAALVTAAAEAFDCDPAFVALPALAAMAGAVGNSRSVRIKKGYAEPCALWTAAVGFSGDRKSPGFAVATEPLQERQHDLFDAHAGRMQEYAEELRAHRAVPKSERGEGPEPPPAVEQFLVEDATIEAVGEVLRDNRRGLLVAHDELDVWFTAMTRYKGKSGGSDRANWLKLHQGKSLILNRVTRERGVLCVRRALASLTGTIQPGILAGALDAEARASGLAARLLLARPPRRLHRYTEAEVPDDVRGRYADLLLGLLALQPADAATVQPHALVYAADATARLVQYIDDVGRRRYHADHEMAAALAKLEGAASRLALVHHVARHVGDGQNDMWPIGLESVNAGVEMAEWFAYEWERIAGGLGESEGDAEARSLYEYVEARGGSASARDVRRRNSRLGWGTAEAEAAMADLVARGWARWVPPARPNAGKCIQST